MPPPSAAFQTQFLDVIGRDEAWERFRAALRLVPLGMEMVPLESALGRILADDVLAATDVPGFDRSNVDGFALRAEDSFGASELKPRLLWLNDEVLSPGMVPDEAVAPGAATTIATGGMVPRGADAVLMVEYSDVVNTAEGTSQLRVTRPVAAGEQISFAGTDMARGETVLRANQRITSREIGVLAALGIREIAVWRKPRVGILSTGDEIIAPGMPARPATVYDSNGAILAAAVRELGGEPIPLGIVPDEESALTAALERGLVCDVVLLSGGTSKGAGDLSYRVVSRLTNPGIVAHGVALKPGKPICLAVTNGKPVVILPGFPTSAIFTFHEFVAPVIRALAGSMMVPAEYITATLPLRVNSERGRTEYLLVNLVHTPAEADSSHSESISTGFYAFPMGKGSGSVTTFSGADGFLTIDQHTELLEAGTEVRVQLLGQKLIPADLVAIGSHCVGLDFLLGQLQRRGVSTKSLHVGSTGGLNAVRRGQCDLAGIHLLDPQSGEYNRPFLEAGLELVAGYRRMQGIVFRQDDRRFQELSSGDVQELRERLAAILKTDREIVMVNRNSGSGTRILIDRLLTELVGQPQGIPGYTVQVKSHNAVAAAVSQGRADWGVAIDTVALSYGLGFCPLTAENYDFVIPTERLKRPAVQAFCALLNSAEIRAQLQAMRLVLP